MKFLMALLSVLMIAWALQAVEQNTYAKQAEVNSAFQRDRVRRNTPTVVVTATPAPAARAGTPTVTATATSTPGI